MSWAEAATDAVSPSESSELRPPEMTSDVLGSGPGVTPPVAIDIGVSGRVDRFCLFFGCGSTVEETPLLGSNRDRDCGPRFASTRFSAGWMARSRIRTWIRHENWVASFHRCG